MLSQRLGETKAPIIVWLFFTLYMVLLLTIFRPLLAVSNIQLLNVIVQSIEVYGVFFLCFIIFLRWKEKKRSFKDILASVGLKRDEAGKSVLWSSLFLPLFALVYLGAMTIISSLSSPATSTASSGQTPTWYIWFAIIQSFFPVALVEEMFGRGYMLDRLMPQHPSTIVKALPAILLSSLLFTLWHVPSYVAGYSFSLPIIAVLLGINVLPNSVILGLSYVRSRTRNIVGPVIVHFLLDASPFILALAYLHS